MIEKIFAIGFHYESLNNEKRSNLFRKAGALDKYLTPSNIKQYSISSINILKTCNRLELYGYGSVEGVLLFIQDTLNINQEEKESIHVKTGSVALHYIFKVAAGLDSMVLGDQEILSQFKNSFISSKKTNLLDGYLERLANTSLQAAKEIRKNTSLTKGTTSLSYATIKILKKLKIKKDQRILLLGLGKFGTSIGKNLVKYFPLNELTVSNRSYLKVEEFIKTTNCEVLAFNNILSSINDYDIIVSALETEKVLVESEHFDERKKIIIDLSMPSPFSNEIHSSKSISYYTLDDAAELINSTWEERKNSIEPANKILEKYIESFKDWSRTYSHSSILKEWKNKLTEASEICPFFQSLDKSESTYYVQKSMGHFAQFVKSEKSPSNPKEVLIEYLQKKH